MHPDKIVIKLSHENMTSRVYSFPNDSKLLSNLFVGSITVVFQVVKCGKKVVWHFSIFCLNHYSYRGSYPSIKLHLRWSNLYENWSKVLHTGSSIYMWTQSFIFKCSHDRDPSHFKITFKCYYTEISFEMYNSSLGQLA